MLEICWTHGIFRNLFMTADKIFKNMGNSNTTRKELMHQIRLYRMHKKPFDTDLSITEIQTTW